MRPTILKVEFFDDVVRYSREQGKLLDIPRASAAHARVVRKLEELREALGRDPFFVIALSEPNDEGGLDILPTFQRALDVDEEPDW